MVTSRRPGWPVSSFSLESKSTLAVDEVNAMPKFVPGFVSQPCTSEVMSMLTYVPAAVGVNVVSAMPVEGAVA
jgi:hypothetical protein